MIFFVAGKDTGLGTDSNSLTLLAPPASTAAADQIPEKYIYFCSVSLFASLGRALLAQGIEPPMQVIPEMTVKRRPGFPVELGASNSGELKRNLYASGLRELDDRSLLHPCEQKLQVQIAPLKGKDARIALVNGMGSGLGDTLAGITALREANRVISKFTDASFDVLCSPEQYANLGDIYRQTDLISGTHKLPMTLEDLMQYDAYIDTGGMIHRDDFNTLPTVDFFLKAVGIDYRKLPAGRKRNRFKLHNQPDSRLGDAIKRARDKGRQLLLFHPVASTKLRSVPDSKIPEILDQLLRDSNYQVVTALPLVHQHPDLIDLSGLSTGFSELCYIISNMDAILTVDTSIFHIADCYNIPTVVWFTSIDPDLRIRYYPRVHGMLLEGARDTGMFARHIAKEGDNLEPVTQLWSDFTVSKSLIELENIVNSKGTPGAH